MSPGDPSPLDTLDGAFRLLASDPSPLSLDGRRIGLGLPARPIPLSELRAMLLHPSTGFAARDAALTTLVARAQQEESGAWLVGLAGVLLPGLRRMAGRLARDFPGDTTDLDCEVLAGSSRLSMGSTPRGGGLRRGCCGLRTGAVIGCAAGS